MKSHSQAGQDAWVIDWLGTEPGFFVDVGAEDGVTHSNTYALEQLGWTGICIEPNRDAYDLMSGNRKRCTKTDLIVSDVHGIVEFDGVRVGSGVPRACMPLSMILDNARAPNIIDYLSIDVEGHELEVLAGMDFARWHVRLATIEHNSYCDGPARKEAIAAVMTTNGFDCYADDIVAEGYGEFESWWVHRDG